MAITKIRRTQAERTEATKQALIDSAIKLLNSHGYAGATLALIAEDAGVTRGSILHQFGTRAALMTEVVKWVYAEEFALYGELIPKSPHRGHKLSDWPLITWQVLSRPSATAVLEILQGSRSDADLAEHNAEHRQAGPQFVQQQAFHCQSNRADGFCKRHGMLSGKKKR